MALTTQNAFDNDCIQLNERLPMWLGERLIHLSRNTHGYPLDYEGGHEAWTDDLNRHGVALMSVTIDDKQMPAAQDALRWVADNLMSLWD